MQCLAEGLILIGQPCDASHHGCQIGKMGGWWLLLMHGGCLIPYPSHHDLLPVYGVLVVLT